MPPIPPLDLTQQYQAIGADINQAVLDVLASGQYIKGPPVTQFETRFAHYIGTSDCLACNSGTDALYLALRALEIGPGDEVITSPFTFIATAETISAVGATPVFVDVEADTFNIDLNQIEAAITPRTKAIVPVHLFGQPVDMTKLMAIAQRHGLFVVEDCAQAVGAQWNGQTIGSIGDVGCFSFYPTKNLGAYGDGGAVTTNRSDLAAKMRVLSDHGRTGTYYHETIGINSRLDSIQAAILLVKLRHLNQWNTQRRQVAERYSDWLAKAPDIAVPRPIAGGYSVWHQYTIRIQVQPSSQAGESPRDRLRQSLREQGVISMVYYPIPLNQQPAYRDHSSAPTPVAQRLANTVLSLPMFPELTADQQLQVVHSIKNSLQTL
ncbi:MAG: DegT/DnrJ/EryC1/StrS family aminotransferase [Cyanobacteria bacterium P01_A01_bin.135]